ncbi:MAG: hypothetical protein Q9M19_05310 [Mariprofundaceae bacterium]|nr:hypothetical protein [Mariprofundaceae bacterium]
MTLLHGMAKRLEQREDSEHEQAMLRMILQSIFLIWFLLAENSTFLG